MEGDDFGVGCLLSVKTTLGEEFQAQIITFDRPSNLIVLHILPLLLSLTLYFNLLCFPTALSVMIGISSFFFFVFVDCIFNCYGSISFLLLQEGSKDSPSRNIRLLKANYIKEFTLLGQGSDPLDLKHCQLDLNLLQSREDAALRQATLDAERIGVGVTNEAQNIFDALSKTLPVRWDKAVIVVMNEVRVTSPYHPENVSGGTSAANERVKKVLEFERKRLHTRGASQ